MNRKTFITTLFLLPFIKNLMPELPKPGNQILFEDPGMFNVGQRLELSDGRCRCALIPYPDYMVTKIDNGYVTIGSGPTIGPIDYGMKEMIPKRRWMT